MRAVIFSLLLFLSQLSYGQKKPWKSLGPFVTPADAGATYATGIGRINCITFHPQYGKTNATIYAGSPTGGLFISENNGKNWRKVKTDLPLEGISEILFDLPDPKIIYLASGDRDAPANYFLPDGGNEFSQSQGVYVSYDEGKHWNENPGLWNNDTAFWNYPTLKNISSLTSFKSAVYAAIYSVDFKTFSYPGSVYRSSDKGKSWDLVFQKDSLFVREMHVTPDQKNIYAAGTKLYVSTTGSSDSWKQVSLPNTYSRIELASSKTSPSSIYALAAIEKSGTLELYSVTNDQATFVRSLPNFISGETRYTFVLEAIQTIPDLLYFGNIALFKSLNKQNFTMTSSWFAMPSNPNYMHADVHSMRAAPDSNVIFVGHDGGISLSRDTGKTWINCSDGLDVSKIYRLSCSQNDPSKIIAGTQDAGTMLHDPKRFKEQWGAMRGGDGAECFISYHNDSVMVHSDGQNNVLAITQDNGKTWRSITPRGERGDFLKPVLQHPTNPSSIFAGYHDAWKSENLGRTWTKISDFSSFGIDKEKKLVVMAVANSDTNVIYAGFPGPLWGDDPKNAKNILFRTKDGGKTWTDVTTGLTATQYTMLRTLSVDPKDPMTLYAGFTQSWVFKVMRSTDGGDTWQDFSEGLSAKDGVNSLLIHGRKIYAGTHRGVYVRNKNGYTWKQMNKGLPVIPVFDLAVYKKGNKLRAATCGRGVWECIIKP